MRRSQIGRKTGTSKLRSQKTKESRARARARRAKVKASKEALSLVADLGYPEDNGGRVC